MSVISVGIADLNIAKYPDVIATYALGSCVGICLYDEQLRLAGLAHIMLPWSKASQRPNDNLWRYADTGIADLVAKMKQNGANVGNLTAKIAGGAQMFKSKSDIFNIGQRNVDAVKQVLASYKIPIIEEDTGNNYGRTVFFYSENGRMEVRSSEKKLSPYNQYQ